MSLCLVGNYEIDALEELAVEHFSAVENKDFSLVNFKDGPPMFDDSAFGHMIKIVPIKDNKSLSITWPQFPSTEHLWDSNPLSYISHVVGLEGKNSLLSELIKQDLATGLSSGERSRCQKNFSGFNISVILTDKGV